jgi:hypothetical protein
VNTHHEKEGNTMHTEPHPRRGETVHLAVGSDLHEFEVEDWWDRVSSRADAENPTLVYGHVDHLARVVYDADLRNTVGHDHGT